MTKERRPVTIENTLFKVLGKITIERAAELTDREPGYLRSLSDPNSRYRICVEDAVLLDVEYRAQGGLNFPLYETYGQLLEAANAERFSDAAALHLQAVEVIREGGQAHAALVTASLPGATEADKRAAAKELEEAADAISATLPMLTRSLTAPP
ncbi:hypothetical protein [Sphingomonas sp. UYP23]